MLKSLTMYLTSLLLSLPLTFSAVFGNPLFSRQNSYPDPQPCSGNCTWIHDPSVLKRDSDGTYFRLSTNGNIAIATAPALTGPWTYQGAALPQGSSIQILDGQELWAPDVFKVQDTYYAYYAVSKFGLQSSQIGLISSPSMDFGTWTDHGSVGLPLSADYNLIDPNHFFDSAGNAFTNFGSGWKGIFQTPGILDFSGGASPINEIYNSTIPVGATVADIVEGTYEFAWNGAYFMFFSSGACCSTPPDLPAPGDEYKVMVCRSDSASGPFVDQAGKNCLTENGGTLLLGSHGNVYAPGGQGVMVDGNAVVIYYHYVNPTIGYAYEDFQFGFNYLDFSTGWPVISG